MSSSIIGKTSPSKNQISSLPRSFSVKGKEKEISPVISDVIIDIPSQASSSSQKNEFSEGLKELIQALQTLEPTKNTDRIKALEKIQSKHNKEMLLKIGAGVIAGISGIVLLALAGVFRQQETPLAISGVGSLISTAFFLNNTGKKIAIYAKIKEDMKKLETLKITPQQMNDVFMEELNGFIHDAEDDKKFANSFKEQEIRFLADTNRIIKEYPEDDWHITLKDNILALKDKKEITKEDFLNVVAQNIIPILRDVIGRVSDQEKEFMKELLKTAQGFVKRETPKNNWETCPY